MKAMGKFEFEFGAEGPKARFNPFEKSVQTIAALLAELVRRLNVRNDAAELAGAGRPPHDQPEPSAKEMEIRARHIELAEERVRRGKNKLLAKGAELETVAVDIIDSDLKEVKANLKSRLNEIRTVLAGVIRTLIEAKWAARENLRKIETVNRAANQPTGRSMIEFFGATLITAIVEAIIGGYLFQEQVGYAPGIGLAFGIGLIFAFAGSGLGVGFANVRHASKKRKIAGAAILAIFVPATLFLIFVIAHYRISLGTGAENLSAATRASIGGEPLAPFFDGPGLAFMSINAACLWLVAWEASRFLGWLDLRRARLAAERTEKAVRQAVSNALAECEAAKIQALEDAAGTVETAGENAIRAKTLVGECVAIVKEVADELRAIERSHETCQQAYREIFASVSRAGWAQARFAAKPPAIGVDGLELDSSIHAIAQALIARSVKIREAQPELNEEVHGLTDQARRDIDKLADEVDEEVRFAEPLRVVR
jgi:hypothetical protein